MSNIDEMIAEMDRIIRQYADHPEWTRTVARDRGRLLNLKVRMMPPPPLRVERSEFVSPDDWLRVDDRNVLGRFAWSHLMRMLGEPIPEFAMEPDIDFPRDCAP